MKHERGETPERAVGVERRALRLEVGMIVRTSYGSGPYRIVRVTRKTGPGCDCGCGQRERLEARYPGGVPVSALRPER